MRAEDCWKYSTIDTSLDLRSDAAGDADTYSPTMGRYHRLLWSKPLPGGAMFDLEEAGRKGSYHLRHSSELGEFKEERAVREGMTEEELAVFNLLTQPDPVLTDRERETVKASAKQLLAHLHEKLVEDWRRKVDVTNDVNSTIRRVLDEGLPQEPYTPDIFTAKVQIVFDHVLTAYGDKAPSGQGAFPPWLPLPRP